MSRNLAEITDEALRLPQQEQLRLARTLLEQSEAVGDVDAEAAWEEEIESRIRLVDAGLAKGRPFPDVLRDIDRHLGRRWTTSLQKRPVVVIYDGGDADLLVAPVTSQMARSPRDVPAVQWQRAGLRLPSIVRLEKLATVEKSTVIKKMGRLAPEDWEEMKSVLKHLFAEILAG